MIEENKLYCDDCLTILKKMDSESIDMIYIDPPFFSQTVQRLSDSDGNYYEFNDKWTSKESYLQYIKERLIQMPRILKNSGSIFLQCDISASCELKLILDEVFGKKNFRGEIIWYYKRWSNSRRGLLPNHQTIYYYSKTSDYKFNTIFFDYSPTTNIDQILQERERNNGKVEYKRDIFGQVVFHNEKNGVPLSDVWEIPFLNPKAKERVGYPTQKPIELLDRIIRISTDEGDSVLDAFCGSGTTLVSAKLLGRNYIGIDNNPAAIALSEKRLHIPIKTQSKLLQKGKVSYLTKSSEDIRILRQFNCNIVQRNRGIDALLKRMYNGKPVAIKIQKEPFNESVQLLANAAKSRDCSLSILISNEVGPVPDNMILITRPDLL